MAKKEMWMQRALRRKPGALHRQLGIPIKTKIPRTLLRTILSNEEGTVVRNPTKVGRRKYKITRLMRQRANPVFTVGTIRRKRKRR